MQVDRMHVARINLFLNENDISPKVYVSSVTKKDTCPENVLIERTRESTTKGSSKERKEEDSPVIVIFESPIWMMMTVEQKKKKSKSLNQYKEEIK